MLFQWHKPFSLRLAVLHVPYLCFAALHEKKEERPSKVAEQGKKIKINSVKLICSKTSVRAVLKKIHISYCKKWTTLNLSLLTILVSSLFNLSGKHHFDRIQFVYIQTQRQNVAVYLDMSSFVA